jgi:hypothetical protein
MMPKRHDLHQILVLAQKGAPRGLRGGLGKPVGAEFFPPAEDLALRKPRSRVYRLSSENLVNGQGMPHRTGLRVGHRLAVEQTVSHRGSPWTVRAGQRSPTESRLGNDPGGPGLRANMAGE